MIEEKPNEKENSFFFGRDGMSELIANSIQQSALSMSPTLMCGKGLSESV